MSKIAFIMNEKKTAKNISFCPSIQKKTGFFIWKKNLVDRAGQLVIDVSDVEKCSTQCQFTPGNFLVNS